VLATFFLSDVESVVELIVAPVITAIFSSRSSCYASFVVTIPYLYLHRYAITAVAIITAADVQIKVDLVANLSALTSIIVTAIVAVALADIVTVIVTIVMVEVDDTTDNIVVMVLTVLNI
jgi:hypothetical protein